MRLRKWGLPVLRTWTAPEVVQHLGDPDEVPAPTMTGTGIADPDGPPDDVQVLDVPPERRPWDTAEDAGRPPHCSGRHALAEGLVTCEYCEALTGAVSLVRSLEKRVVELEREVADLRAEYEREMRERES